MNMGTLLSFLCVFLPFIGQCVKNAFVLKMKVSKLFIWQKKEKC